tara:strand:- start:257 stop:874 length:618 start_codon:yes stop_codon:yes gene_type:complete
MISAMSMLILSATISGQERPIVKLDKLLSNIDTITAEINQLIVESDGGILEESQIIMHIKRPEGFYWETVTPFPELLVTNGKRLWNYQPDLEQVVIEDWNPDQSALAAQLLYGKTENLEEDYYIVAIDAEQSQTFELKPKSPDNLYELITISFINSSLELIYIENSSGERTAWQFTSSDINPPLGEDLFEFIPPDGIEIIYNSID